ncbi:nucleotidyltransferase family protein [Solimonas marina]|uniref:Nucleotidyltransferase family protein n=1 Tax=Solimonas marina TaxID=2714601 RepID=A0A970B308_9GAMM|nr:nucleotidyltransferase family protein [Solimonas marina]
MVLAAGRSRRFGHANKLLAPLHGRPLLWQVLDAVATAALRPAVIVLGHEQRRMRLSLQHWRAQAPQHQRHWRIVVNRRYRDGMGASLRRGLSALPGHVDASVVCLADMPQLDAALLRRLRATYRRGDDAVVPVANGRRGNPVLLGRSLFASLRAQLHGDGGARRLIAQSAAVRELPADHAALLDIDTRRQWQQLRRR